MYVKFGAEPTTNNFDEMTSIIPPTTNGIISIGPPLTPGRYFYGVYVPCSDTASQSNSITATYYMGTPPGQVIFNSSGPAPILDDAVMTNSIFVTAVQPVSSVEVALRVDHPRVSDLVFHLTSPDGTRVLLVENRGGTTTDGMGQTIAITNIIAGLVFRRTVAHHQRREHRLEHRHAGSSIQFLPPAGRDGGV